MQNNEEQEFRDRLYDYESDADAEATWAAVQAGLQPRRKRRAFWWWIPLLLLLGGGVYAIMVWDQGARPLVQDSLEEWGEEPVVAEITTLAKDLVIEGLPSYSSATSVSSATSPLSPGAGSGERAPQDQATTTPPETTTTSQDIINLADTSPNRNNLANDDRDHIDPANENQDANNPANENRNVNDPANENRRVNPPAKKDGPPALDSLTAARAVNNASPTVSRFPVGVYSLPQSVREVVSPAITNADPVAVSFERESYSPWSLSITGTYSFLSGNTTGSTVDGETSEPAANSPYENLEALSTDLLLGYQTPSGWRIRSGIGYTRINSVAGSTSISIGDSSQVEGITRLDIGPNGDTTAVMGLVNGFTRSTRTQRYYNRLMLIDIPILIGKEFQFNRWRIGVEAGPVFNLRAKGDARYLMTTGEFTPRSESDNIFRPSLGVNLQAGLSAGYRLTNKLELEGGLRYRSLSNGSIERSTSFVQTTYDLIGVNLGLMYRF